MKIILINPPEECTFNTFPGAVEKSLGVFPPLGLLYVAASIKQYTDWKVEVIDAVAEKLSFSQIKERIKESAPDAAGITVMTHSLISSLKVAETAKESFPGIKVIFGGPHAHLYPENSIFFNCVDYVSTGEGEEAIVSLLRSWGDPDKIKAVPGLFFKTESGQIKHAGPCGYIKDLDKIMHPAIELVDYKKYYSSMLNGTGAASMITSRGCPYNCGFCARPNLGKKFRARSPEDISDEVEKYINLGIRAIVFFDDTFTIDKERVLAICREFGRRDFDISWSVRAHINDITIPMLSAMKKAGCEQINYGVESGNNSVLERINKGITTEKAIETFKLTKQAGLKTGAYFMIGCPGETKEEMRQTIAFSIKLNPDYCYFTALVPFPFTQIYSDGLANGRFGNDYWSEFSRNPQVDFRPRLWIENVPEEEILKLLKSAYKKFYLRPSYIIKRLLEVRSVPELKKKITAGLDICALGKPLDL